MTAFPTQPLEPPTVALYLDHLKALPWREGRTEAAVRTLIATRLEPHLPSIGVVVAACGVGESAAPLLVEAMARGIELVPDLGSRSGWAVGRPAIAVDGTPALAAPDLTEEERRENLRRLGGLVREFRRGRTA